MKITIVQGAFFPVPPILGGAVEKWWFNLGPEFAARGHTVTHISRRFQDLPLDETIAGVHHRRVSGFATPKSLLWLKTLDLLYSLRVLRALPSADILVTHTFWLPVLCRRPDRGRICVHVARFPKRQMGLYRRAARLQAVSSAVASAIRQQTPRVASLVRVLPVPLSNEMLAAVSPRPQPSHRICYAGRIHPEKGLKLLVTAFSRLVQNGLARWTLRLIGPWRVGQGGGGESFLAELKSLAAPCDGRVEFLEPEFNETALRRHYQESDLFVYPSLAETGESFGAAPLEAMANGCPALVSALECFQDFIRDGENGFVFNHRAADNVSELTAALQRLTSQPELLRSAATAARSTAERYSAPRVAEAYLEDFATLLAHPPTLN